MKQVTKFYFASFLKNQTYFTPIMILFLQFHHLTFQKIFWIFTISSVFSFIIEIPTGIIADIYGKKKSIVLSKFIILLSFISFGFAKSFLLLLISQMLFELGQAFRSGTETAYTFEYLKQNKEENPSYTEVKGKQKFYARIGESIATAIGGFVATIFNYNAVFFLAAIPAAINFIMNIGWENIKESDKKLSFSNSFEHIKASIKQFEHKGLRRITINIMIFTSVLAALEKFIQPYMTQVGIPISLFGIIYSMALALTALAVRYSYVVENKFGEIKTINTLTFLAIIPCIILGLKFSSIFGVILFFLVVIIENIRNPIANSEFHQNVRDGERATMGSILSLFKSLGKIAILPVAEYFADIYTFYTSILIMTVFLIINAIFFSIKKEQA